MVQMESLTDAELEELGKEFQDLRERAERDLDRIAAWRQRQIDASPLKPGVNQK